MEDRSFELLWGERRRGARGPVPGLSVERIAAAAIALADAEGLGALSMRRLAGDLGVAAMALYRYVPGKTELLDVMVDTVIGEQAAAEEGGWRERLAASARASRALHERHPWLAPATLQRPPLGPNAVAAHERLLAAAAGIGLSPAETVAAAQLVAGYARSAAGREEERGRTERFWAERSAFWERYYEPERFPALTALYEAGAFDDPPDAFEFGLQRILDGIEARR
jgi:AcrR family transcriptional regulator